MDMMKEYKDIELCNLTKNEEENENALGDGRACNVSAVGGECHVGLMISREKISQKLPTISSTTRPRCVSCLLGLVKALDLFINISIIGLNLNIFHIRKHLKCLCKFFKTRLIFCSFNYSLNFQMFTKLP